MSLKGKIEAIIYAAEEPVTLDQLRNLLGGEVADLLDARAGQQLPLPGAGPDDPISQPIEPGDPNEAAPQQPERDAVEQSNPAPEPPERDAVGQSTTAPEKDARQQQRAARERERALRDLLREQLDELIRDYATGDRGLEIREVANGFRLATRPEYHDAVRGFARSLKPPLKLSLQALETLAVVAYKQPVTAPEVGEIRGVDSGGVLGSLMARKLIVPAGRKQVVGRPILYKTTKEFLLRFGLRDVSELPSIEEFEKLAGELADSDPIQETMPMLDTPNASAVTAANLREEEDATEPQADGDQTTEAAEALPVDGRLAGLTEPADPSAAEADIQRDQQAATEGTED